jgi:hypothetical protein
VTSDKNIAFYAKMPNKKKYFFIGTHPFRPKYFGPYPKFKILLPRLFNHGPNNKVCMPHPCRTKTQEEIDFLETGHFWPRAIPLRPADLIPPSHPGMSEIGEQGDLNCMKQYRMEQDLIFLTR